MTQLLEDLKATRAELVKRGRSQGHCMEKDGRVCLIGAAIAATDPEFLHYHTRVHDVREVPRAWDVVVALNKHIARRYHTDEDGLDYDLAYFNDSHQAPYDHVILDLIDDAIEAVA